MGLLIQRAAEVGLASGRYPVPLLALPPDTPQTPRMRDQIAVYLLVLLPWVAFYELVQALGRPARPWYVDLPFERRWPVIEWTEAVYASTYVVVALVPLLARSQAALRRFAIMGLAATLVVGTLWLTLPVVADPRPFEASGPLGRLLQWERSLSVHVAAFPSFHVLWAMIAAELLQARSRAAGAVGWAWAALVTVSCSTTGQHAIVDLAGGALLFVPLRYWYRRSHSSRIAS